ncbi:hypothetical protein AJ78_02537 [Emergomyces pasteurianus Ep9510]|uniref:Heterokaryon incompatibility domain-containing protein n=1 Tax=Emergomyces pasteurianus Ep9510 TaxID=1447872 RepID=A0A1J9PLF9_9EURO|nr:hypothetical protein AJ78_02537 [Emergomyces pasteurianus Ep9510]
MLALGGLRANPASLLRSARSQHALWVLFPTNRTYNHIALAQSDSIRLAEILPGQSNDKLQLQLHHTTLHNPPAYEALSYEWAGNSGLRPVKCGSQEFHLSANLRAGLKRLRYTNRRRLIWVDAICIDQDNCQERSHQVSLMRDIYRNAQKALIWIGEEREHTGAAFDIIPQLAENWVARGSQDDNPPPMMKQHMAEPHANQLLDPSNIALWNSIIDVFTRPYFKRTWIIQEIIVSRTASVICGGWEVDWTSFHRAANHIVQDEFRASREPQPSTLFLIALIRRIERRFEKRDLCLRTLLRHFRASKALDPRDKVYALLGLVCGKSSSTGITGLHPNPQPKRIIADYTKPIEHVYRETAAYIIMEEQNLKLLTNEYPPNSRERQDMPSWVPDWSANTKPLHPLIRQSDRLSTLIKGDIQCTDTSLFVNGNIFDTVSYASEVVTAANEQFILRNLINMMTARAATASYATTNQSLNEALCRTLIANNANLRPALGETESYFFYLLRDRMTTVHVPIVQDGVFNDPAYLLRSDITSKREPYLLELRRTLYDRAFFTTRKGHMGIGPKGKTRVKAGDRVAILGGGFTPFILREVDAIADVVGSGAGGGEEVGISDRKTFYTLVGESYIHGMMEGEFLEKGQELGYQRIEIR